MSGSLKTGGMMAVYIPSILIILCFYVWWIGLYEFDSEIVLGILLIILGMLYACAIYLVISNHPIYGISTMLLTLVIVITIAAVSKFKEKDGSNDSKFLCLGVTPFISCVCFAFIGAFLYYASTMI